ncbi:MAG: hypothetical protein NVSMB6_30410 [Burkholderiaceae bacterium]
MLGGALVGLGLGSLLSSGDRNNVNQNSGNQNGANANSGTTVSGAGADGTTAAGTGAGPDAMQPADQQRGIFSHPFLLVTLALLAFIFIRRARRRALRRRFGAPF